MKDIVCYVGGEARGNPGPAAIGVCIIDAKGFVVEEIVQSIGNATKEYAVCHAVMAALEGIATSISMAGVVPEVKIRLDDQIVKQQLNSETPVTEPGLIPLFITIHNRRVTTFPQLTYELVPVSENIEVHKRLAAILDGTQ